MLRLLRKMIARMGLAGAVVLVLAVATPALASHVCTDTGCAPAGQTAFEITPNTDAGCSDCGPACANGCCHAPHPATSPDLDQLSVPVFVALAEVWSQDAAPPLNRPVGPDRPPRS